MEDCKKSLCSVIPDCLLNEYCINGRKPHTLSEKAELAASFEHLGDTCLFAAELKKKYSQRLTASRRALKQLRQQNL